MGRLSGEESCKQIRRRYVQQKLLHAQSSFTGTAELWILFLNDIWAKKELNYTSTKWMSVILICTVTVVVWKRQLQKKGNKISRVVAIFVQCSAKVKLWIQRYIRS